MKFHGVAPAPRRCGVQARETTVTTMGTQRATPSTMRTLAVVLLLQGCFAASTGGGNSRPGVMPMLSELPGDAEKRDAILDQSGQTAGPEHRKGQTVKERKAETFAATAAAILGSAFSKTQNVTLGGATTFGGGDAKPSRSQQDDKAAPNAPIESDGKKLVPWIKLDEPDRSGD
jgi:hypothetical protein